MLMAAPFLDAFAISSIVLSAGTYLFDFSSNLVVLVEYSTRFMSLMRREKQGLLGCDAKCREQTSQLAGYFYALLGILACSHSLNAVLFKLKFAHSEAPLFAAYFLPLIHLYRFSHLVWRTLTCEGVRGLRSPEMNGLYCILGSAMEGVPMLILQFCGYLVLTRDGSFLHSMSTTFKVSVAASLVSAAYNGGTSVQSIAKNAITLRQRIGAGATGAGFTLSATLSRCLAFTNIIVHIRDYFSQHRTLREQAKFHVSDTLPVLVIAGSIIAYSLHFWLLHSPKNFSKSLRDPHCFLTALAFSYMSTMLGPLYPMISQAIHTNELGCCAFRLKLFIVSLLHLLLDLTVLCVTRILGTLPTPYLIVSLFATVGYLAFLIAYIKLDASCGPDKSSNVSIMAPGHRDDVKCGKADTLIELCMLANARSEKCNEQEMDGAVPHEEPCAEKTNLPKSEHAVTMSRTLEGPSFPSEIHRGADDRVEIEDSRSPTSSCCSVGRDVNTTKRDRPSSIAA